jgi:molecular chaperone GrpE (heat shock protein)
MTSLAEIERRRKKAIRIEINDLIERKCKGCSIYTANYRQYGQTKAQEMCGTDCAIGQQLLALGKQLLSGRPSEDLVDQNATKVQPKEVSNQVADGLTREKYLELCRTLPDYKIANQFNISTQALKRRKEGWGIPDRRRNPAKPSNSENTQAKGMPDRPTPLPTIEKEKDQKAATEEKDEQTSANELRDVILAKVALLEQQLQEKDEEIAGLKAKNEQLRELYEQQIKEIQEASIHRLFFRPQDLMHLTIKTDKEDVADNTKRALQKLGVDFDYKVRKGVIEVTTAV